MPTPPAGPPVYTVNVNDPAGAKGLIFYTTAPGITALGITNQVTDLALSAAEPSQLVIRDKAGKVVWQRTAPLGTMVGDLRTQIYQGHKVLTWWEGIDEGGHGAGDAYIADEHYRIIKKISLPQGYAADIHEFRLTPDGRALITAYKKVSHDMSAINGPKRAQMNDGLAFVVDVASGKVLRKWSALEHIPISYTRARRPLVGTTVYDPYHINSLDLDAAGDLIISFRNLSAVYGVSMRTGKVTWVLGGAHPTIKAGPGVTFSFQHDAELISPTVMQLFNDNALGQDDPKHQLAVVQGLSSVQRIKLDLAHGTATLVSNWTHPDGLVAVSMGNAQPLAHGHVMVGWGSAPRLSEFDERGRIVYDASLPTPTYRAFLDSWGS